VLFCIGVVVSAFRYYICGLATYRPGAGLSYCCRFFYSSTFVKHITSRFGAISIYIQVGSNPPVTFSKKKNPFCSSNSLVVQLYPRSALK
jgi:hypothetical protein